MTRQVLVVRLDGAGDVLLAGPAVRAVAAAPGTAVTMLCGPAGTAAARLLPGVRDVLTWSAPWVLADPPAVDPAAVAALVADLAARRFTEAVVLTSFHQSPLPTALLLRLAGVPRITGASVDYPGALLDVRVRPGDGPGDTLPDDLPEPERALAVAAAAGYPLPDGDDGRLAVIPLPPAPALTPPRSGPRPLTPDGTSGGPGAAGVPGGDPGRPYVVVHPGAAAPARRWPAGHHARAVELLAGAGWQVVVTGGPDERTLTAAVAGDVGLDLGGRTSLAELGAVLAGASAVVVGNTAAAHLSAAVGTPVVSLFAPVVPAVRWGPYRVPHVLLGDAGAACRDTRARECPVPGHPCLAAVRPEDVAAAVHRLAGSPHPIWGASA
ncbi:MAG TPA: glycosyltransferase family 9 protein [Pseudonocardia sp.]|nr:glycosyltransferase family 9 protein [Pseudonocardia sp.]